MKIAIISATRLSREEFEKQSLLFNSLKKYDNDSYVLDVSYNNVDGLSVVYNRAINKYKESNELQGILFVHDDVNIIDENIFSKIENGWNDFEVLGLAGSNNFSMSHPSWNNGNKVGQSGRVEHYDGNGITHVSDYGPVPSRCMVMDGLFLAVKMNIFMYDISFDEAFKFHHYDMDFCLQVNEIHEKMGTVDIRVAHASVGVFSDSWQESAKIFRDKWGKGIYRDKYNGLLKIIPYNLNNRKNKSRKIGIGITTCNREDLFWIVYNSLDKSIASELVIVNDGKELSSVPVCTKYIKHDVNKSVCLSKNEALRYLFEKECDYMFIIEDDVLIKDNNIFNKYIEASIASNIQHLIYGFSGYGNFVDGKANGVPIQKLLVNYGDVEMVLNHNCAGSFCMYTKECIDNVGYFDEYLKYNCWEHIDYTAMVIEAGMHPPFWYFADINESWKYLEDMGSGKNNSSIIQDKVMLADGERYLLEKHKNCESMMKHNSDVHVVFKSLKDIERKEFNVVKISKNNRFVIAIPTFNAEKYIKRCIDSIKNQEYKNYIAIIIDDCSTDDTYNVAKENIDDNFVLIRNEKNMGSVYNMKFIINKYSDNDDIIVNVDGDDSLYDSHVLSNLNREYQNENVWLTYGSMSVIRDGRIVPVKNCSELKNTDEYRKKVAWCTTHLKTFHNKLFKHINDNDLIDEKTNYYYMSAMDVIIMFPMIEMAGKDRIRYIKRTMYVYNDNTGLNDHAIRPHEQSGNEMIIRKKSEYKMLDKL